MHIKFVQSGYEVKHDIYECEEELEITSHDPSLILTFSTKTNSYVHLYLK